MSEWQGKAALAIALVAGALACFGGDSGTAGPSDVAAGGSGGGTSGGTGATECTGATGDSGCACYPNETCNGVLVCVGGTCVLDDSSGGSGGTGTSGAGGAPPPGCVPDCAGRTCGPDPVCNTSCGTCSVGTCNAAGLCEGGTAPGGPTFLSFSANTMLLEYNETLIFSAVLTDPDGIDDLIGGTLVDAGSGATYGSFQTSAAEGSYSLSVSWDQIDTVITIEAPPTGIERAFRAEFFDQGGNKATGDITVTLRCSSPGSTTNSYGCCAGTQTNWNYEDGSCGSCDSGGGTFYGCPNGPSWAASPAPYDATCSSFRCEWLTMSDSTRQSCTDHCLDVGATCVEPNTYTRTYATGVASYSGASGATYLMSCDEVPPAMDIDGFTFASMTCFCGAEPVPSWFAELPQ